MKYFVRWLELLFYHPTVNTIFSIFKNSNYLGLGHRQSWHLGCLNTGILEFKKLLKLLLFIDSLDQGFAIITISSFYDHFFTSVHDTRYSQPLGKQSHDMNILFHVGLKWLMQKKL